MSLPPLFIDVRYQEFLGCLSRLLELNQECGVEGFSVLEIEVAAVLFGRQSGMAIGRDDEIAIHI